MSSPADGAPSMSAEVDKFLEANVAVDEGAAGDLRTCPPEVQRIVLSRGDLSSARNPSAALIARIRDARTSAAAGAGHGGAPGANVDAHVEAFLSANSVDESAAASLRSSPPDIQRVVVARGDLTGARNPSSALLSRIRDAKMMPGGGAIVPGSGTNLAAGMGAAMGAMVAGGMPHGMAAGYGYSGYGMYAAPGYGAYGAAWAPWAMGGAYQAPMAQAMLGADVSRRKAKASRKSSRSSSSSSSSSSRESSRSASSRSRSRGRGRRRRRKRRCSRSRGRGRRK